MAWPGASGIAVRSLQTLRIRYCNLGDKGEAHKCKQYNAGHVADLNQAGASRWGTDWLGESKVPSRNARPAPPRLIFT